MNVIYLWIFINMVFSMIHIPQIKNIIIHSSRCCLIYVAMKHDDQSIFTQLRVCEMCMYIFPLECVSIEQSPQVIVLVSAKNYSALQLLGEINEAAVGTYFKNS
ncbi:unnamed protein product [Callosobruchus maculatus]|uniref:Secreted protein n=1 Tax=Callosobruchus maculatus TaxID=64391 RepID=A0A653BY23_CALMS|nr:unnamed protein product [Callosobruchus maculatus]